MHRETAPSQSPTAATPEYRPQLDGLRFLAFLGVFFFHANPDRYAAGSLGVPLFFVLSGFLITRILLKNQGPSLTDDLRVFYIRRTLRIFPLYYATLVVLQVAGRLDRPLFSCLYLTNFDCYFHGSIPRNIGHFWTLSVEEQFYLVYPLLLLTTPARLRFRLLWVMFGACALSRHFLEQFAPNPFTGMLPNVAGEYLIAGAIVGYLDCFQPGGAASPLRIFGACLLAGWATLWIAGLPIGPAWTGPFVPDAAAGSFALLVWDLWKSRGFVSQALGVRPLAYLGKISYGCYVFHYFVLQNNAWLIARLSGLGFTGAQSFRTLPALVATIAISMLSWHLFESPILALKSRFSYKRIRTGQAPLVTKAGLHSAEPFRSILRIPWRSWKRNHVANVGHSGCVDDRPFKA